MRVVRACFATGQIVTISILLFPKSVWNRNPFGKFFILRHKFVSKISFETESRSKKKYLFDFGTIFRELILLSFLLFSWFFVLLLLDMPPACCHRPLPTFDRSPSATGQGQQGFHSLPGQARLAAATTRPCPAMVRDLGGDDKLGLALARRGQLSSDGQASLEAGEVDLIGPRLWPIW